MLTDFYVLAPERSALVIARFVDRFLPRREQSAADYTVPEYSDNPYKVFTNPHDVIQYAVACKSASQRIYWHRAGEEKPGEPIHAHVFFLADGGLVLGLSVAEPTPRCCEWLLEEMKECVGSRLGYFVFESPPAESAAEFERLQVMKTSIT